MIIWAPGTAFGTALHAVTDSGLDIPIATTSANMIVAQMKTYASFAPEDRPLPRRSVHRRRGA